MQMDESAEEGALRELNEETGLRGAYIRQFYTFTAPDRDPRERVITIAYYALVRMQEVKGGDDAADAQWFALDEVPQLAFDHDQILRKAEQALRRLVPFRSRIEGVMAHLMAAEAEYSSPLIEIREVKSVALVVFGTDDGLCGAYNINIFKEVLKRINECREKYGKGLRLVLYPVGKKMIKQ